MQFPALVGQCRASSCVEKNVVRKRSGSPLGGRVVKEMATPSISVVIPVYNAEETLRRCVNACLRQETEPEQVIVVDNNSQDGSAAIAGQLPVTLVHEPVQGSYAARNRGVAESTGEVLAFTDPDCVPRRKWITELLRPFEDPEVQISIGRAIPHSRSVTMRTVGDYEHTRDAVVFDGEDADLYYGHTNCMAVRRTLLDEQGGFDDRMRGGDVIAVQRCVEQHGCNSVRYVPDAHVVHLEVDRLRVFLKKVYTYGWSNQTYKTVVPKRVLSRGERWDLFRRIVKECGYSRPRALLLLSVLGLEGMAWRLGTLRAAIAGGREPTD